MLMPNSRNFVPSSLGPTGLAQDCAEWKPWFTRTWDRLTGAGTDECIYTVIADESLDKVLLIGTPDAKKYAIQKVLHTSDVNCDNFRAKCLRFEPEQISAQER